MWFGGGRWPRVPPPWYGPWYDLSPCPESSIFLRKYNDACKCIDFPKEIQQNQPGQGCRAKRVNTSFVSSACPESLIFIRKH